MKKLAELLDRERFVHVRGTPASEKSTLAHLLERYYVDRDKSVFYISIWKVDLREAAPWGSLTQRINSMYQEPRVEGDLRYSNSVLLIDEAQGSYSDSVLWNSILKDVHGFKSNARVCLFSSTEAHPQACRSPFTRENERLYDLKHLDVSL